MNVAIAVSEVAGRHLVAKHAVSAGDILMVERAYAFGPIPAHLTSDFLKIKKVVAGSPQNDDHADDDDDDQSEDSCCFHCLALLDTEAPTNTPVECPGCEFAFCSSACQLHFQQLHQLECPLISRLLSFAHDQNCQLDELRYLIMALRMIIHSHDANLLNSLRTPPQGSNQQHILRSNRKLIDTLQANFEIHKLYEPDLVLNARKLTNVLLEVVPKEILGAYARSSLIHAILSFNVNCYAIGEFGVGLFFFGALASHSCSQNCSFVDHPTQPGCKVLRALKDIQEGEEITISYLGSDLVMPTFLRRQKLLSSQLFWCECARCKDPLEQGRLLRCVQCPSCAEIAMNPLPTPIKAPPAPQKHESKGESEGDDGEEHYSADGSDTDDDHDAGNDSAGTSNPGSSSSGAGSSGDAVAQLAGSMDQPEENEEWSCSKCSARASGPDSHREIEKKAEELFLAAKQLLLDEDGTLAPGSVEAPLAEKAMSLLEFSLLNSHLHAFHYLKDMARELLNAVFLERQMFAKALGMVPTLIETASRLYQVDHFEKGQLFETLAQLTSDAEGSTASEEVRDDENLRLLTLRKQYIQHSLKQYQSYFGENAAPTIRLQTRLAGLG